MPTPLFRGQAHRGKLILEDRAAFDQYLRSLEGPVVLILKPAKEQRTLKQNAFYWSVLIPLIGEHCGYDAAECHEALKQKFLPAQGRNPSTTELDTKQFADYVDACIRFAEGELQIKIPAAGEVVP